MQSIARQQVALFLGHDPRKWAGPDWEGTLEQFWESNLDSYPTFGDVLDIQRTLGTNSYYRMGGGAEQAFTLVTPDYLADLSLARASSRAA